MEAHLFEVISHQSNHVSLPVLNDFCKIIVRDEFVKHAMLEKSPSRHSQSKYFLKNFAADEIKMHFQMVETAMTFMTSTKGKEVHHPGNTIRYISSGACCGTHEVMPEVHQVQTGRRRLYLSWRPDQGRVPQKEMRNE